MPDIWERLEQLIPNGLRSWDEAVILHFPAALNAGANIQDLSVKTRNGMAKILACWMLAIGSVEFLTAAETRTLKPALNTLANIHCTWDGVKSFADAVFNAIGVKNSRSLAQRMDPDQLLDAFCPLIDAKLRDGSTFSRSQLLDECINDYNVTQSADGAKLDSYERKAVKWLDCQLKETRDVVKSAWPAPQIFCCGT